MTNTREGDSIQGRPYTFSEDYMTDRDSYAQAHPITYSGFSTVETGESGLVERYPAAYSEGTLGSEGPLPGQPEAHPITFSGGSIMNSGEPESTRARPLTFSGDSLMDSGPPLSAQGHPISYSGFSFNSGNPDSGQRQPETLFGRGFMGSAVTQSDRDRLEAYPITFSGGSVMNTGEPTSVRGRPVSLSGDSVLDSGMRSSAQGHPITYSGSSIVNSGELHSNQGQPRNSYHSIATIEVPRSDSASQAPIGAPNHEAPTQAEGHPITFSGGSIMSSGGLYSSDAQLLPLQIHASVVAHDRGVATAQNSRPNISSSAADPAVISSNCHATSRANGLHCNTSIEQFSIDIDTVHSYVNRHQIQISSYIIPHPAGKYCS